MIYDSSEQPIFEQSIVRLRNGVEQAMVISIHNVKMEHQHLCSVLTIYGLSNSEPKLLFYSFHPDQHRWVLVDKLGLEWETV